MNTLSLSSKIFTSCFVFLVIIFFVVTPVLVNAETSELQTLSGIPGLEAAADASDDAGFAPFINSIFKMAIGLGSALAVAMIIFTGVKYSTSVVITEKMELKDKLMPILGGLALLLGAFVILEVINPQLTNLELGGVGNKIKSGNTQKIAPTTIEFGEEGVLEGVIRGVTQ